MPDGAARDKGANDPQQQAAREQRAHTTQPAQAPPEVEDGQQGDECKQNDEPAEADAKHRGDAPGLLVEMCRRVQAP